MSVKVVELPAVTVVGMKIVTMPMSPDIPALWPKFVARIDEIENPLEPNVSYGVMWPGESMDVLNYMAVMSVAKLGQVPSGMESTTLPAGSYASFKYPLSGLGQGFGEIFSRLLPSSGFVQTPGPLFERYDEKFDPKNSSSLVEIGVPVKKLR
jgi:AraC family transcriptional regulator